MAIYEMTNDSLVSLDETSFSSEKVYERKDLQRLLKDQINAVESDLLVISEEFGDWADSSRRIDLLCLDKNASLVVIELKRTEDGGHMDLQSIRYAAMISPLTFDQAVSAYDKYKQGVVGNKNESERDILSFLGWQEPLPSAFGANVRIILVSSDFSKELTTSVIWLNNNGLDIQCVRMKPYKSVDGKLFIDIQKIIPLPEAEEYQTKLINKGTSVRLLKK